MGGVDQGDQGGPRSRRGHRALVGRGREGQTETPFSAILTNLIESTPLALGAAIVDFDGETVDFSGTLAGYDLKVAAAHFRILLEELKLSPFFSPVSELRVRAKTKSYVVQPLDANYALMLCTHRLGAFAVSRRALTEAAARICTEAGIRRPATKGCWYRVEVETIGRNRRPVRIRLPSSVASLAAPPRKANARQPASSTYPSASLLPEDTGVWTPIEVIGALRLDPTLDVGTERGFRLRLTNGAELTLVAERNGLWFVDEALWALFGLRPNVNTAKT